MQKVVWIGVVLLAVLHQDLWYWDDKSAVFGFMPVGLAYHAGYSIAAALIWAAAVKWAWPSHLEAWADEPRSNTTAEANSNEGGDA